ncbi:MAG: hypothetical protein QM736_16600 [Vicinamibacterales bacterium]
MRSVLPFEVSWERRGKRAHHRKYGDICLRDQTEDMRRRWARRALLSFPEGRLLDVYFGSTLVGFTIPANLPLDARPERPVVCELIVGENSVLQIGDSKPQGDDLCELVVNTDLARETDVAFAPPHETRREHQDKGVKHVDRIQKHVNDDKDSEDRIPAAAQPKQPEPSRAERSPLRCGSSGLTVFCQIVLAGFAPLGLVVAPLWHDGFRGTATLVGAVACGGAVAASRLIAKLRAERPVRIELEDDSEGAALHYRVRSQ